MAKKEVRGSRKMSKADETTTKSKKEVDVLDNSHADVSDKHAQEIKKLKQVIIKQKEELNTLRAVQPKREGSAKAGMLNQTRSGRQIKVQAGSGVAIMTQEASAKVDEAIQQAGGPNKRFEAAIFKIDKSR